MYEDLVAQESLKPEPRADHELVRRLLTRAEKDLAIAKKILLHDEPTALDLVYKSMFHAGNALVRSQGFRPGRIRQHRGVVEAVRRTLGSELTPVVAKFDRLRQKRNEFEYQALFRGSRTEIKSAFQDTQKLLTKIRQHIGAHDPQKDLGV